MSLSSSLRISVIAVLALAACPGPKPKATTQSPVMEPLAKSYCRHYARCRSEGVAMADTYEQCKREAWWQIPGDVIPPTTTTRAVVTPPSTIDALGALQAAIDSGAVQVASQDLTACLSDLEASSCELDSSIRKIPSCAAVLQGTLPDGAPCQTSLACGASSYCKPDQTGCGGTCQPGSGRCLTDDGCSSDEFCSSGSCLKATAPPAAAGQPCDATGRCADGLYCPLQSSPRTCQARSEKGQSCSILQPCGAGLFCGPSLTCEPQAAIGASCDFVPPPSGEACAQGTCLPTWEGAGICVLPWKLAGTRCSQVGECDVGLHCDGTSHTCVANPLTGACVDNTAYWPPNGSQPQITFAGGACDPTSTFCDESDLSAPVCRPFVATGASCVTSKQCDPTNHEVCGPADGFVGQSGVCHVPTQAAVCASISG